MNHAATHKIEDIESFGAVIRQRRTDLCFTQAELSELSGVNQANLSRIEKGAGVTLETLLQICQPLGIDLLAGIRK